MIARTPHAAWDDRDDAMAATESSSLLACDLQKHSWLRAIAVGFGAVTLYPLGRYLNRASMLARV